MSKNNNSVGEAVRCARVERGLSQTAVGRAIGRSQWFISRVESGIVRVDESAIDKILAAIARLGKKQTSAMFADLALPNRVETAEQRRNVLQGSAV